MATYKGIKGVKVQSKASDPTASEAVGTVWYNTTGATLKYAAEGAGTWAAGTAMNTGRAAPGSAGTTSLALVWGGETPAFTINTETWNGSTWTEVANLPVARFAMGGFGTSTAAVSAGGYAPPTNTACDKWDGSTWTATGVLNSGTQMMGSSGTQTAGMKFGGDDYDNETETFNGSTWTAVNVLNLARKAGGSSTLGTTTASLFAGGEVGPAIPARRTANTELWNGTTWSEDADLNTARDATTGSGTSTLALVFSGGISTGLTALTESWNGTSWTEVGALATASKNCQGIGSNTSAFNVGGNPSPPVYTTAVEEYTDPSYVIKTVTVS